MAGCALKHYYTSHFNFVNMYIYIFEVKHPNFMKYLFCQSCNKDNMKSTPGEEKETQPQGRQMILTEKRLVTTCILQQSLCHNFKDLIKIIGT